MNAQLQEQRQDPHNDEDHNQQIMTLLTVSLLVNNKSNNETEPIPDPITPIHLASIDPPMADTTSPQVKVELSKIDIIKKNCN